MATMGSFGTSPTRFLSHAGSQLATWNACHACCVDTDSGTLQNRAAWQALFILTLTELSINHTVVMMISESVTWWYYFMIWYGWPESSWHATWIMTQNYDSWLMTFMILWWMTQSGVVLGCELLRGQGFPDGLLVSGSVEIESEDGEPKTLVVPPVSASWLALWSVQSQLNYMLHVVSSQVKRGVFCCSSRSDSQSSSMLHLHLHLHCFFFAANRNRIWIAKDLDLNRMAGNTISINVIGSLIAVLLASVLAIGRPYYGPLIWGMATLPSLAHYH